VEAIPADQGAVSVAATKVVSPLLGAASYRRAVKQLLTSVVREICTLRSVGAGVRATAPGHPVVVSNHDPYSDRQVTKRPALQLVAHEKVIGLKSQVFAVETSLNLRNLSVKVRDTAEFLRLHAVRVTVISLLLLAPCFWHRRIETGDMPSHAYNAWLAQLIERGDAPGLYIVRQWNNVMTDLARTSATCWDCMRPRELS